MLRKFIVDLTHVLTKQPVKLKEDLPYEEEPIEIFDRREQVLRTKLFDFLFLQSAFALLFLNKDSVEGRCHLWLLWGTKRWLCRYSVTATTTTTKADFIADQSNVSLSIDSNIYDKNNDDNGIVLKPAPKPVLKSSGAKDEGKNSAGWDPSRVGEDSDEEERSKLIESLGEVLEKAEKLETRKEVRNANVDKLTPSTNPKNGNPVNSTGATRKTKTLKSVWRKGDDVASVQKVVKEEPKAGTKSEEPLMEGELKVESQASLSVRPAQPPLRPQPKLQTKPSVAPAPPMIKKPVVLKDVGAAPKSTVTDETDLGVKSKERKPILIDKFATKKSAVDPLIAKTVLAPTKPGKGPSPGKFKDDYRNKKASAGGSRRRIVDEIADEETSELNVSIPGARKGRKWSKASRKAARLRAAQEAAPVKVEILELEEDGMLVEDLAYNLAVNEVKMEEMARKREIFDEEDSDKLEDRPPVLTIMGHVDHGKTTLLDHIRKSKVAASEAGGITQGIGAYKLLVPVDGKLQPCVFLDTPGHEAFGAMRARGARVTDIAVIVVAADDGIRPQTNEAIAHAKAAGVPIVIAINKIDKDGANPDRVMQELSSIGLMPEDWGGDIPMVKISALKGENVDDLLETIMLVAELQELKANPHRNAKGTRGCSSMWRSLWKGAGLFDDAGKRVDEAGPSIPVQVIGLNSVPIAGDEFEVVDSLDVARERAEAREDSLRNERIAAKAGDGKVTLSSLASAVSSGKLSGLDLHQLNVILKVDVQGSIEAVRQALQVLPQDNVTLKFLLQATGDVSSSDVDLAIASKAIILGFNVKAPGSVKSYADNKGVEIRLYRVIYDLIDDVRKAMEGLLDRVEEQVAIGSAEVRAIFTSGSGRVAGCMVTEGKVVKGCGARVLRKGKTVHVGVLDSLKRVKEIVKEVNAGLECGMGLEDFDDFEEGDIIEAFNKAQKTRTLEEASASMAAALEGVGMKS
ncbi:hypothetical protein LWI28_021744 [Acer negundo]|uniref:Translation initiation factor IF-2, chloroplastic n=1 Tax=Acer negundo TaxID=4023 RepID=A0AAD5NXE7_ACENE|nr:hypothetical protein LWI28_021744 [Acer negundo]